MLTNLLTASQIVRTSRLFWSVPDATKFYAEHRGKFYFPRLVASMTSGPCMALALAGPDAIQRWRQMLGPTKVYEGKWEEPHPVGLRAQYGVSDTRNGFHGSGEWPLGYYGSGDHRLMIVPSPLP